jgi:hypothetical protein
MTTSHEPRDVTLRDSATPTGASRQSNQAAGRQIRNPNSEIRNFSNGVAGIPKIRIPNSEFTPIRYYHSSARARLVERGTV